MDRLKEECGVVAVYQMGNGRPVQNVAPVVIRALIDLQNRGQLSAGLTSYNPDRAREKTERIYEIMERIIQISKQEEIATAQAADRMAEDRLASVRAVRSLYRRR